MYRKMQLAKETYAGQVGLEKLMQTSLQGIAMKATRNKEHRFQNLYQLLNEEAMRYSWKHINKKSAAGVDKQTARAFKEHFEDNIAIIVERLKRKKYRARLVRRVYIDKGQGKKRPLGIPTVSDKLVQHAAAKILEAIYEPEFSKQSYGYRLNTGAQIAIKDLNRELNFGKYSYIVEADIKGFFDHIDHEILMKMLEQKIADKTFLRLIRKWLEAGVLETDGKVIHPITGTPQGGIISPILANIYLHYALDTWFEKAVKPQSEGESYISRYADDFVCAFRYKRDATKFYRSLGKRLKKFGLELAKEKTNIISFSRFRKEENTKFEFLGFEFRWGTSRKGKDIIKRRTSRNKLRKSFTSFREWSKENRNKRIRKLIPMLNAKLRGYYNYYGVIGNYKSLWQFYQGAMRILYKWLNRRSQRRSFNLREFTAFLKRYGVLRPRITETRHYQLNFDF